MPRLPCSFRSPMSCRFCRRSPIIFSQRSQAERCCVFERFAHLVPEISKDVVGFQDRMKFVPERVGSVWSESPFNAANRSVYSVQFPFRRIALLAVVAEEWELPFGICVLWGESISPIKCVSLDFRVLVERLRCEWRRNNFTNCQFVDVQCQG